MKKILTTTILATALALAGGTAVHATEPPPERTVEVAWLLPTPEGGWLELPTAETATWDQPHAPDGPTVPGACYQIDTYLEHEAPIFYADGVLRRGEDYRTETQRGAISWYFVCVDDLPAVTEPPVVPEPLPPVIPETEPTLPETGAQLGLLIPAAALFGLGSALRFGRKK